MWCWMYHLSGQEPFSLKKGKIWNRFMITVTGHGEALFWKGIGLEDRGHKVKGGASNEGRGAWADNRCTAGLIRRYTERLTYRKAWVFH